jgi:hypothetical protein
LSWRLVVKVEGLSVWGVKLTRDEKSCCEVGERSLGAVGSVVYILYDSAPGDVQDSSGQSGGDRRLLEVRVAKILVIVGVLT